MAERAVHCVGSYPAESTDDAMSAMIDAAGPRLRSLPTGETRRYEFYVEPIIADLVAQGVLEPRPRRPWVSAPLPTIHRISRGRDTDTAAMDLGYPAEAAEALPVFERLRRDHDLPGLSLQIGMPSAFTLAFTAMGLPAALSHRKVFADATVRAIERVRELAGDDVVIQLEGPAELVLMARAQHGHRLADTAVGTSRGLAALAAAAPAGTRFGVHLCLGSRGNKGGAALRTARPLVDMANSVAAHWPSDRPLEFVHAPFASGATPPPSQPEFYAPLADLELGAGTAFYAGFVHDGPEEAEQAGTLRMIESALGRPVDGVASPCGLGRRPRAVADAMVARANRLAAVE
ncbi:hypothetical protein BJY24_005462 [Nocardia transvalensis]|uniref:Uncharacterized protein n=1 Tax=Nocardia transvalensis TaxID=37333 RepID=A0A7W9PI54_9NOCA|nr:hypothetical protein [Nocardia transvalensis]MBB5916550.1 hypothetical protein [Nocardia transvalensis]